MSKTCTKCGVPKPESEFYVRANGRLRADCKVCCQLRNDEWEKANPDRNRELKAAWAARNPEKLAAKVLREKQTHPERIAARMAKYLQAHRGRMRDRNNAWRKAHPQKFAEYKLNRRAAELLRTPDWFGELDQFVMQEAVDVRSRRASATGVLWEIDHVVPLQGVRVSGLHVWNNVAVVPKMVNREKRNSYHVG